MRTEVTEPSDTGSNLVDTPGTQMKRSAKVFTRSFGVVRTHREARWCVSPARAYPPKHSSMSVSASEYQSHLYRNHKSGTMKQTTNIAFGGDFSFTSFEDMHCACPSTKPRREGGAFLPHMAHGQNRAPSLVHFVSLLNRIHGAVSFLNFSCP